MKDQKIKSAETLKTNDYSLFKFKEGNREVDKKSLKLLIKKIQENDLTHASPIIVNENMEILDGQHRFKACEGMGLPIYYTIIEDQSGDDIIIHLNSFKNTWKMKDFIHYWAHKGNKSCIEMQKICTENDIPIKDLLYFIGCNAGVGFNQIKDGTFNRKIDVKKIVDGYKFCERTVDFIKEFTFIKGSWIRSGKFRKALFCIYEIPEFDEDTLRQGILKSQSKLSISINRKEYVAKLIRCYNSATKIRKIGQEYEDLD